jgi:hypothetical protein
MAKLNRFAQYSTTKAQLPQVEHHSTHYKADSEDPNPSASHQGDLQRLPYTRIRVQVLNHCMGVESMLYQLGIVEINNT